MRPCGMATPWPSPVEPRRSRANRLSVISARERPWMFSNRRPASSNARFLLVASTPTRTWAGGRMDARRFMVDWGGLCTRGGALQQNGYLPAEDDAWKKQGPRWRAFLHGSGVLHHAFGGVAVVVLHAGLVLADLAVQLVDQLVEGGIEVLVRAFGKHVVALHVDLAFCALPSFLLLLLFDGQQDLDVDDLVKVAGDSIKLGGHVVAESGGNFEMVTADRQVHGASGVALQVDTAPLRRRKELESLLASIHYARGVFEKQSISR